MKAFILCLAIAAVAAEPQMFYSGAHPFAYNALPYAYGALPYTMPYGYVAVPKVKTFTDDSKSEVEYAGKGTYVAESAGAIHKAKREAQYVMPYTAMPYSMPYTMPYAMSYGMPYVYPQLKTYTNDDTKSAPEYAGKGTYYAESAGAIHKAKREAEPWVYTGYPYTAYPYASTAYSSSYLSTPYTYSAYNYGF